VFVTDTHPLAYYAGLKHSKLGRRARGLFEDAGKGKAVIFIPVPALWEMTKLAKAGLVDLPTRFDHWCRNLDADPGFAIETLSWLDVDEARHLPFNDPFDCLIVGTALRLDYPLITKDEAIVDSKFVETVW
jgi:PIN domain nuclease of toxin-antitoxin system